MTNKQIYQTIRRIPEILKESAHDPEEAKENWEVAQAAVSLLGEVTPRMLLQVFPVTKEYDGERWGTKDYFFTMRALKEYGLDTPLGENALHVLWDYMNPHISIFMIWVMGAMSDFRVSMGGKDPLVEFMEEQGMPTYTMDTDASGREVMVNSITGEAQPVIKPKPKMPRWWRVIEGGIA